MTLIAFGTYQFNRVFIRTNSTRTYYSYPCCCIEHKCRKKHAKENRAT